MEGLAPISRTVQSRLYDIILNDILLGIHPPGVQLNEAELSRKYGVSRSPLRETLGRLAGEGLLEVVPNKGTFVRKFTEKYINDVLNMREILERRGIRNFVLNEENSARLLAMRAESEGLIAEKPFDVDRHNELDARMHELVMSFNDSEYINQLARQIYTLSTLFSIQLKNAEGGIESEQQHVELIDILLKSETATAEKLIQKHIRRTKKLVRNAMRKEAET